MHLCLRCRKRHSSSLWQHNNKLLQIIAYLKRFELFIEFNGFLNQFVFLSNVLQLHLEKKNLFFFSETDFYFFLMMTENLSFLLSENLRWSIGVSRLIEKRTGQADETFIVWQSLHTKEKDYTSNFMVKSDVSFEVNSWSQISQLPSCWFLVFFPSNPLTP